MRYRNKFIKCLNEQNQASRKIQKIQEQTDMNERTGKKVIVSKCDFREQTKHSQAVESCERLTTSQKQKI